MDRAKSVVELDREKKVEYKTKLTLLAECDEIVSEETVNAVGRVTENVRAADDNAPSSDELDEGLEEQYKDLNFFLDLPDDTYSLTAIRPELPTCVRYGVRAGLTHINMPKFSPLSRGHQGGATAIAAFATTTVYKSRCWNEAVIDQIIEDGDSFYCESYKEISTDDRRLLTILHLGRTLCVQNKLTVNVTIEDAAYAGKFRSSEPTELHLVKALELFFKRYKAGILCSSVLNIALWKDTKYFNIFDGQARKENCEPAADGLSGTAKLFLVRDLIGVLFIILEKSQVGNEPFVLYAIAISGVDHYTKPIAVVDTEKIYAHAVERRPSSYKVQDKYRAVLQGSYHIMHPALPALVRGRTHMIIALASLVYSRLVNGNKWTSGLVDLIFNQSNIYFVDLVRVLDKDLADPEFELKMDDAMGDVILGVYSAKVKIRTNVVPGYGQKRGKVAFDTGFREFFESQACGLLEIKGVYYAIWRHDDTYYYMDPYACDDEGFRSGTAEIDGSYKPGEAACVTMNSSINQVLETIMENTGSRDRDPFIIHGVRVLYVKTGVTPGGPLEYVIYREKGTNRRPQAPPVAVAAKSLGKIDEVPDMTPTIRPQLLRLKDAVVQVPPLMKEAEMYMMTDEEPRSYVILPPEEEEPVQELGEEEEEELEAGRKDWEEMEEEEEPEKVPEEPPVQRVIRGYRKVGPYRLVLQGSKNCLDDSFEVRSRGKQGLMAALVAIAYRKLKDPKRWRNVDVDQLIDVGDKTYGEVIEWIRKGSPAMADKTEAAEGEEEEEELEEGEEEEEERLQPVPSHLDLGMLPARLKFGENDVIFKSKMDVIRGDAAPLANLAEALECYFKRHSELLLENKRLIYAVWKDNECYFLFNPYGSDAEGWRLRDYPASFAVLGSLNELVTLLHGVIEFNEPAFTFHFVSLDSIQPGKYATEVEVMPPGDDIEMFKTSFLPITDDDIEKIEAELKTVEEEEEDADVIDVLMGEEEEEEEEEEEGARRPRAGLLEEAEKPLVDPLLEVREQEQPDAPYRLNLALLTAGLKIPEETEEAMQRVHAQKALEKLKYEHPPPYVLPSNKTLTKLLEAKRAKRSVPSLVSRFSIDSRLDVKKKGGFGTSLLSRSTIVMSAGTGIDFLVPSKKIKLCPKRYLFSRLLPICLIPIRAIDDMYIQHDGPIEEDQLEETPKRLGMVREDLPEAPVGIRIRPALIPLGPIIRTPVPEKRLGSCPEKRRRKCLLSKADAGDALMEKILCNTEDLLLELFFPDFKVADQLQADDKAPDNKSKISQKGSVMSQEASTVRTRPASSKKRQKHPVGWKVTEDGFRILLGDLCLEDRASTEECHFKSCFFAALLCVLAKIKVDPDKFRGDTLDQFVYLGEKIHGKTGKLRFKPYRWFHHVEIMQTVYNVITKQAVYADPESSDNDELEYIMDRFFEKNQTGIIAFANSAYAFWAANGAFYLFDPYSCDELGNAGEGGSCALMEFCELNSLLEKLEANVAENTKRPFRLYTVCIAHMETKRRRRRRTRKKTSCVEKPELEERVEEPPEVLLSPESSVSLIEQPDWVTAESRTSFGYDATVPGFAPIRFCNASMLEVTVLENEITAPVLAPFKKVPRITEDTDEHELAKTLVRKKVPDRRFKAGTMVATPLDLCVMAWSLIHDPITWSVRTVRGLFETVLDYSFDSLLAAEDSTAAEMTDGLLNEFEIGNYVFRAVFVPLHYGTLYATEGWNLAMSLQKVFDTPSYTGAIVTCGRAHLGTMKRGENHFAWWIVAGTQSLRIVTAADIREFLRLVVKVIDQPEEETFVMRVITVSYAQKVDPDCSDTRGLHEPVVPAASLPEIHRMPTEPYDLEAIFRPTVPDSRPIFVHGTVALSNRDALTEPRVKRCYFVAVLAVMVQRDIVQSPMPDMVDKVLEVAESVYREFPEPKFHTEHILRNVTIMNRIFDLRDCALPLALLTVSPRTGRNDFYLQVRKHLKRYFRTHASGMIHFTNCCYGFWYSRSTNAYYYIDPYPCNEKGRRVSYGGRACLGIFPGLCQMVKNMCFNQHEDTTGFFIHRVHVDSVNVPPFDEFKEDPIWLYLDYHWNFRHAPDIVKPSAKRKRREEDEEMKDEGKVKQFWNNYAVEVSNLIYSAWGTIGAYDSRFGDRGGKNQAAICVAVLAMQYLSHPSRWGPAILDSAVICGDSYYTESVRGAAKCAKYYNHFNLQPCFKIFPHLWVIDFREAVCGTLYGAKNKITLAAALNKAFEESPNILVECNRVILAGLAAKDGFYMADPGWVGPPLFERDHGAIYVLRCRNMNCLVYAMVKTLNTNKRMDFRITPVAFTFEQEDFNFVDAKSLDTKKKVFLEPLRTSPGKSFDPGTLIPGADTVPDQDSYLVYHKNLSAGIKHGDKLEYPELPSVEPTLKRDAMTSAMVSTTWHLNLGQADPLKKPEPKFDPLLIAHDPEKCEKRVVGSFEPRRTVQMSITDLLAACDDYPRVVDFKSERTVLDKPVECAKATSFLTEAARDEFNVVTKDMRRSVYATYKHRLPKLKRPLAASITEEDADASIAASLGASVAVDGDEEIGDVPYNTDATEGTEEETGTEVEATTEDD
ncbi:uncharacterized protein LOC117225822 [Megalopta genalis]|uniref:uncharacterized protein LOC117225822 n=1 Tax=Megalopta genalis TaxID=115081 RepID=UPI003FCFD137